MRKVITGIAAAFAGSLLGLSLFLSAVQSGADAKATSGGVDAALTTPDALPATWQSDLAAWCAAAKMQVQLTCKTAVLVATAPENDLVYQDATWRIVLTDDKGNETVYVKSFYYSSGNLVE